MKRSTAVAKGLLPASFLKKPAYQGNVLRSASQWMQIAQQALNLNQELGRRVGGRAGRAITAVNDAFGLGQRRAVSRGTVQASIQPTGEIKQQIVTAPLATGVSQPTSVSPTYRVTQAPSPGLPGIGGGLRLTARFMAPNTAIQNIYGETTAFSSAAGFNTGTAGINVPALHTNPGDDRYHWLFSNVGMNTGATSSGSVTMTGIFATVPKLAALARCFERFLIRRIDLESVGELQPSAIITTDGKSATRQVNGVVRFGYVSDPFSLVERDWENVASGADQEKDFQWVANLQAGATIPFWQAEHRQCLYSHGGRTDSEDYRYVHMNVDDTKGDFQDLNQRYEGPVQTVMRQMMQGAIVCAHDLGDISSNDSPAPKAVIVRRNFLTVTIDLHNLILGAPVSTTLRIKAHIPTSALRAAQARLRRSRASSEKAGDNEQKGSKDRELVALNPLSVRSGASRTAAPSASRPPTPDQEPVVVDEPLTPPLLVRQDASSKKR